MWRNRQRLWSLSMANPQIYKYCGKMNWIELNLYLFASFCCWWKQSRHRMPALPALALTEGTVLTATTAAARWMESTTQSTPACAQMASQALTVHSPQVIIAEFYIWINNVDHHHHHHHHHRLKSIFPLCGVGQFISLMAVLHVFLSVGSMWVILDALLWLFLPMFCGVSHMVSSQQLGNLKFSGASGSLLS